MSARASRKNFRTVLLCTVGLLCMSGLLAPFAGATVSPGKTLPLYSVSTFSNQLTTIDPFTDTVLTTVSMTISGDTVVFANSMAQDPVSGKLFVIVSLASRNGRELVTVDPTTGLTTRVGNTGINIAGIAFAGTGALYGVTGDAANGGPLTNGIPASLYTLDTTTGAPTFMKALGTSVASCTTGNGEAIGFNIDDGLIYHASGTGACQVFETIDPTTLTQTNIALSGDVLPEVLTIVHWSGNLFLISTSDDLYILSKNGQARHLSNDGATGSFYKGLVFGGTPPACPPLGALYGAANIGPDGPSVLYSINPATAAATMIGPIGFERVSGIAFNSAQTLYGTGERQDGSNTHVLMTINPCTGAGTEVGPTLISSDGFATATDISVRGSDGTLFAFLSGKTADALATLNTSTGAHTIIASYQINSGGGLAFSPSSVLFNAYGTNLEALDPTTGTVTTVVPFGFPALFLPGNSAVNAMDFQPVTGNFFGSVVTATAAGVGNFLVTIDPIAAGVTSVGQTQTGLDAIAFLFFPPASITVTGGSAQSTSVTHTFASVLQATVKDSNSNPVAGVTVTFTAPGSGASATFAGGVNTAVTNASGVATSVILTANSTVGGPYSVAASVAGVATPANFALTNTPGPPAQIAVTSGTPQTANVTTAFALPLVVTVRDSFGNVTPGATVTFAPPATGASGTFAGGTNTAVTNSSGVAISGTFTANATTGGPYNVTASLPSSGSPEFMAATALPEGFTTQASFSLKNVDFSVAATTTTQTVKAGVTANYSLNFTAVGGNSVATSTFSCEVLPALSACVFTPTSLPASSPTTPFTLAISTTAAGGTTIIGLVNKFVDPFTRIIKPGVLALFATLALLLSLILIPNRNFARLRVSAIGILGLATLLLATSYISGCGAAGPPGGRSPGTPAGTYTVTVVGTSGSVQRSTTVTLVVQ